MIKTTLLAMFVVSVLLTGTIAGPMALIPSAEALKGKGVSSTQYGSATKNIVCGDRLCSEVGQEEKPKEETKKKEQAKQEKKTQEAKKATNSPNKDKKSEVMDAANAAPSKSPKTVTGVITSVQDPGQGHESHQLAIILPPSENTYRGHLTFTASENVQLVALHGPLKEGMDKGQPIWTTDGKKKFGLTFVDNGKSAGFWQFSGNAIAVHAMTTDPFTVTYSVTYTEHPKGTDGVIMGTTTSKQDPGIGHEKHQLAMLLPLNEKPYRGNITFDASEQVQIVSLIGPLPEGLPPGMQEWTIDGETMYGFVLGSPKSAGSTAFSGNALAFHTFNNEPFTVSYSIVLTK